MSVHSMADHTHRSLDICLFIFRKFLIIIVVVFQDDDREEEGDEEKTLTKFQ